ncbi:MAG: site-specific integrase [Variovorax sp.]|nr:site-specific integrase [Variovorax sp.]
MSSLDPQDLLAYATFLDDPTPEGTWIGPSTPRSDPSWKPFLRKLTPNSVNHSLTVLGVMFDFLKELSYLSFNPIRLLPEFGFSPSRTPAQDRSLTTQEWRLVRTLSQRLEDFYGWSPRAANRLRFIINFVHATGLSIGEMADAKLGDLTKDDQNNCWLEVRDGSCSENVFVPPPALRALESHLLQRGIPTSPKSWKPSESLVGRLNGRNLVPGVSATRIATIVSRFFRLVAEVHSSSHPKAAEKFRRVSLHWLRHTHATYALEQEASPASVRANLRHRSMRTMSRYFPSNDRARAIELNRAFPLEKVSSGEIWSK